MLTIVNEKWSLRNVKYQRPVIKNRVKTILENYKGVNIIDVDVNSNKEVSAFYNVFSIPVLILFIEGKESLRYGRNIDFMELEKNLSRYYNLIFYKE